jgi:hypothetical protein
VRQRGFANLADAAALAPVRLRARGVAVHRREARRALQGGGAAAAVHAAAQLFQALDGFGVALPGGASDVMAGKGHVGVAEDAPAEPLAQLPLRLRQALMRGFAESARSLEHVRLGSGAAVLEAVEHAHDVLGFGGVVLDG